MMDRPTTPYTPRQSYLSPASPYRSDLAEPSSTHAFADYGPPRPEDTETGSVRESIVFTPRETPSGSPRGSTNSLVTVRSGQGPRGRPMGIPGPGEWEEATTTPARMSAAQRESRSYDLSSHRSQTGLA